LLLTKRVCGTKLNEITNDNMTRWTVMVSKETDIALRSFLAQRGLKRGDFSRLIEAAVKWRVFDQTLAETRKKFADLASEDPQTMIDEATTKARPSCT
jgi:hypothetical protein